MPNLVDQVRKVLVFVVIDAGGGVCGELGVVVRLLLLLHGGVAASILQIERALRFCHCGGRGRGSGWLCFACFAGGGNGRIPA